MALSSTTNRNDYVGNGATSVYPYGFRILSASDLRVTVRLSGASAETTLALNTDYTVSGVGEANGGNVTLVAGALASGAAITIRRVRPLTQLTDIRNQGAFYPEIHEDAFDHAVMITQQQADEIERSVRNAETVAASAFDPQLPADIAGAGYAVPMLNEDGDGFAPASSWPTGDTINAASVSAAEALASAEAAASSEDAAADSETAAAASETAAAGSATNAGNSATAAAGSASAAATSATAAAGSATAAAGSATAAAGSATAAAGSATTAATANGQAQTAAANAGTSETNAAGSATAAAGSASAAAGSATQSAASAALLPTPTGKALQVLQVSAAGTAFEGTTGPTVAQILMTEAAAPATPSAGKTAVYVKTDGKVYKKNSAGTETEIGAGGAGGINYVQQGGGNPDAESGVTGWTTYADGSATPVDLTGGSPTNGFARQTSNPLRGTGSFALSPGGLGNGVAYTITPDRADIKKGAVMFGSFDYEFSATVATGSYAIWIYDVANSVLIQPTGFQVQGGVAGSGYKHIFSFQLPTNGTTFRVGLHQAVASPAGNLIVDNVSVGPQAVQYGAPVTDWTAWTPTGSWSTNTTYTGLKRRVGDTMEYQVKIALAGAPTSATLTVNLPSGETMDTAKLATTAVGSEPNILPNSTAQIGDNLNQAYSGSVYYVSATSVGVSTHNTGGTYAVQGGSTKVTQAVPVTFGSGDVIQLGFAVPLVGLSSTVQMSSDSDPRVGVMRAGGFGSTTLGTTAVIQIFNTEAEDTYDEYNPATGVLTVKVPGPRRIYAKMRLSGTLSANVSGDIHIVKNGSTTLASGYSEVTGGGGQNFMEMFVEDERSFIAGDTIQINARGSNAGTTRTTAAAENYFVVGKPSGSSAIAASETIAARYTSSAGQSIPGTTATVINFGTKDNDSRGIVTTGAAWRATAPDPGRYMCFANIQYASVSFSAGDVLRFYVRKNGVTIGYPQRIVIPATATQTPSLFAFAIPQLLTGDYVDFVAENSVAKSLGTDAATVTAEIVRVGNY